MQTFAGAGLDIAGCGMTAGCGMMAGRDCIGVGFGRVSGVPIGCGWPPGVACTPGSACPPGSMRPGPAAPRPLGLAAGPLRRAGTLPLAGTLGLAGALARAGPLALGALGLARALAGGARRAVGQRGGSRVFRRDRRAAEFFRDRVLLADRVLVRFRLVQRSAMHAPPLRSAARASRCAGPCPPDRRC